MTSVEKALGLPVVPVVVLAGEVTTEAYADVERAFAEAEILAIGNPAIFWGSIGAIPYCAYSWWKRRDARAGLMVVAVLAQWLPWFIFANRVQFFFYMVPLVPLDGEAVRSSIQGTVVDSDGNAYRNSDRYLYADCNCYRYLYSHANCHSHSNRDIHANAYSG